VHGRSRRSSQGCQYVSKHGGACGRFLSRLRTVSTSRSPRR
jgi:hypothetical protein